MVHIPPYRNDATMLIHVYGFMHHRAAHPERGLARAGDFVFRVKQTEFVLTSPGRGTGPSAHSPQLSSRHAQVPIAPGNETEENPHIPTNPRCADARHTRL